MPPRIIVHAGFHKTGTTSIQKALDRHRATLAPLTILLRSDMVALCESARAYSISRSPLDLGLVQYEAAVLAEGWQGTVLLSSEDLSGHMPGRRGLTRYDALPLLMQTITNGMRTTHPEAQITFVFTTRDAAPWLSSCHMQHLRATRITLTAEDYAAQFATSAQLDDIVAETAAALTNATVVTVPLESPTDPLTALLARAGVPAGTVPSMPHKNRSAPNDLRAALLDINRSKLSDAEARKARKALMLSARR
mmetsp:Transcript_28582/g.53766  ORF Transcript_28582/g.53766 Transcript_28582/m.53766 type:complete len:251 (+) Transcript_28582:2818-3570(+)